MAEAAVLAGVGWVVSPIITKLLNEGFSYLGVNGFSCLAASIKDRLDNLETTILPQFQLVIEAAEKTEHKKKMERWLRKLKNALYKAEDMLDLYKYRLLEEKVNKDLNSNLAAKLYCKFVGKFSPQKIKLRRSLNKLEVIAAEAKTFRELLQIPIGHDGQNLRNGGQPNVIGSVLLHQVFGREKERDEIIKYLLDPSEASEPEKSYSVGAIVAIGGAGKTTLAQLVYSDQRVLDYFDIKMWVCISRKLDVSRHTREMIESSSGEKCFPLENLDTIQSKLIDLVKSQKVLLVLDDVWCNKWTNETQWQQLLAPLAISVKSGSKILVTTRPKNLPVALRPHYSMALEDLEENHILSLFKLHAFGGTKLDVNLQEELMTIGKRIVRKLYGSPLAAKAVACQLSRTLNVDAWKRALERDNLHDSQQALLWSYKRLDAPLQRCFSYCSLFPKGHHYKAKKMVHLWIAEGFVNSSNDSKRMEDIGTEYFDELVSGSFLQHDENNEGYYMHDLFHDLAENVSKEDCFRIENDQVQEIPPTIRHLSILGPSIMENNMSFNKLENLRTLIIEDGSLSSDATANLLAAVENYKKLRVLMIDDVRKALTKLIPNLKHLRFLSFNCSEDHELLATLGKLYHLQFLDPPYDVASLPRSVKNLINLRHFIGRGVALALASLPDIGRLTSLQTLPRFVVKKEKGRDIGQLKNLNELGESLTISNLENVEGKDKAVEANLKDKRYLESLHLKWHNNGGESDLDMEVLEGLRPHPNLTELSIVGYKSRSCPSWLLHEGWSQNLRSLTLEECTALEVLPPISNLYELYILGLPKISKVPSLPQSLKKIEIRNCPSLIIVSKEEVQKSDADIKKSIMTAMRCCQLVNRELNAREVTIDCLKVMRLLKSEKVDVPEDFMTLTTTLQSRGRDDLDLWEAYYRCQEQRLEAIFRRRQKCELVLPSSLQSLYLDSCTITNGGLSQSLQGLTSLKYLELVSTSTITTLPSEGVLHHLTTLTRLRIRFCPAISALPEHLPKSLRELQLHYCPSISSLPEHLPESLTELKLDDCARISSLPECLPESLNTLKLRICPNISSLPKHLPESLMELDLQNFSSISSLPDRLPASLRKLKLSYCPYISSLPEHLPESLLDLYLKGCPGISSLPEHMPASLKELEIYDCPNISSLPERLPKSLSYLLLEDCPSISSLPECLPESLSHLLLKDCPSISSLPEHLPKLLRSISIRGCQILEERCQSPNGEDVPKIAHLLYRKITPVRGSR